MKVNRKKAAAKEAAATKKSREIVSQLYRQLRGTGLNLGNLRKQDFTAQEFSEGSLKGTVTSVIIATGTYGTTISVLPTKGTKVQLQDGRVFDLAGVKNIQIVKASQARTIKGEAHTIAHGPKKTERAGRIIGKLDNMYVGFVTTKGEGFTLETKALPNGRNKDHLFSVVK